MGSVYTPEEARAELKRILEPELLKCSKCGSCTSVCPIYAEKLSEAYCSRGKLQLAKDVAAGVRDVNERAAEIFNNCLICLACTKNCMSGVRMDLVAPAVRAVLVSEGLEPMGKRLLYRSVLAKSGAMRRVMRMGRLVQPLAFRQIPQSSGLRLRFPMGGLAKDQPVPRVTARPFRDRFPEFVQAKSSRRGEVVYFTGCSANYLFPTIGESVLHVLNTLGFDVRIPAGQGCCGTPLEIGGEKAAMVELARKNVAVLSATSGPIITACGSGGLMLREGYPACLEGEEREKALAVAARVVDFSAFVLSACPDAGFEPWLLRRASGTATYHDPCHLARGMGVRKEPRHLARAMAESFAEMADADRCCGSGGLYGATHWPESRRILQRKVSAIAASKASLVLTGCPSCLLQLEAGLRNNGYAMPVLHTAELAAWCMGYMPLGGEEAARFASLKPLKA